MSHEGLGEVESFTPCPPLVCCLGMCKNARDTKSTHIYYIYCAMYTINDQQEECWRILLGTQSIIYQEIFHFFIRREFWEWEWERENEN